LKGNRGRVVSAPCSIALKNCFASSPQIVLKTFLFLAYINLTEVNRVFLWHKPWKRLLCFIVLSRHNIS